MKNNLKFLFLAFLFFHCLFAQDIKEDSSNELLSEEVLSTITNYQSTNQATTTDESKEDGAKETTISEIVFKRFLVSLGGGAIFDDGGSTLFSISAGFEWKAINYFSLGGQFAFLPALGKEFSYLIQLRALGNIRFAKSFEAYIGFGINYNQFESSEIRRGSWGWSVIGGLRYDVIKNFGLYVEGGFPWFISAGGYYRF